MSTLFKNIINIGIDNNTIIEDSFEIKLVNKIAIILLTISLLSSIIFIIISPSSLFLSLFCTSIMILILMLNYIQFFVLSKVILSIMSMLIFILFYVSTNVNVLETRIEFFMVSAIFLIIPFIIFTTKESKFCILVYVVNCIILIYRSFFKDLDIFNIKDLPLNSTFISVFFIISTVIIFYFLLKQIVIKRDDLINKLDYLNITLNQLTNDNSQIKKVMEELAEISQKNKIVEEQRSWVSDGVAQIAKKLHEPGNLKDILEKTFFYMIKYMGATQGSLFIIDKDELGNQLHLNQLCCYAFDRKKYKNSIIPIGAGLVGQCVIEKQMNHLGNIPENYLSIVSGLGDTPPKEIVIMPLISDGKVEGVMEIATLKLFDLNHKDFLEKSAGYFGALINDFRITEKTEKLLKIAETATKNLKLKEEETDQNIGQLMDLQEQMMVSNEQLQIENTQNKKRILELEKIINDIENK